MKTLNRVQVTELYPISVSRKETVYSVYLLAKNFYIESMLNFPINFHMIIEVKYHEVVHTPHDNYIACHGLFNNNVMDINQHINLRTNVGEYSALNTSQIVAAKLFQYIGPLITYSD